MSDVISAERETPRSEPRRPRPFPERTHPYGPVSGRRIRRSLLIYVVVCLAGAVPLVFDWSPRWKAFGLGLFAPGAGFLYPDRAITLAFFVVTVAVFYLTFILWFAAGNIVFPPAVWLAAAGLAAWSASSAGRGWVEVAVPVVVVLAALVQTARLRRRFHAAQTRVRGYNARLAEIVLPDEPFQGSRPVEVGPELDSEELAFLRWFLDIGLQPIDGFAGFNFLDQFQFAAVRYQMNWMQYALSMAQYARTPAFHGYLSLAQRNLIEKSTNKRVWKYWRLENLWGNLRYDPEPMGVDNVMITGWFGQMLGMYEATTGDRRYDDPGALCFRWSDRLQYRYGHDEIAQSLVRNLDRAPLTLYPCEPNWVYKSCNQSGMVALKLYDRMHGTRHFADRAEHLFRKAEEEFTNPDGTEIWIRSSRLGCTIPVPPPFNGAVKPAKSKAGRTAPPGYNTQLGAVFPEAAERLLALTPRSPIRDAVIAGKLDLRTITGFDPGYYRNTGTGILPVLVTNARELGDEEFAAALIQQADANLQPATHDGARRYGVMSPIAMGLMFTGRFGRRDGFFDLVNRGNRPEWNTGPVLAEVPYPDVLVARAVTDGDALDLVLRPGVPGGVRAQLQLARLVPGRRYRVDGGLDGVTAGADGTAVVEVDLSDRLEVRVTPES